MRLWLHKVEMLVDRAIPPLLLLLLAIIIGELFFSEKLERYQHYVDYFDIFLISLFAVDLAFKFHRVRKIKRFVRTYWIEIIATIPFFLIFRFTEFLGLNELLEQGQRFAHEASEVEKLEREGSAIVKEAGKLERETTAIVKEAGKASRIARVMRSFRVFSRFPRFLKVLPFHERPTGRHHWYEKKRRRGKEISQRSKKYKAL